MMSTKTPDRPVRSVSAGSAVPSRSVPRGPASRKEVSFSSSNSPSNDSSGSSTSTVTESSLDTVSQECEKMSISGTNSTPVVTPSQSDTEPNSGTAAVPLPTPPLPGTPWASSVMSGKNPDVHARVLTFQQSRQSRSNSGSNTALNFTPPCPALGSSPRLNIPSSVGRPASLSRSSSSGSSSAYSAYSQNLSSYSSPVVSPQPDDSSKPALPAINTQTAPRVGSPQSQTPAYSGALFISPSSGAMLQPKRPSLSQRRGMGSLESSKSPTLPNLSLANAMAAAKRVPESAPPTFSVDRKKRSPGLTLSKTPPSSTGQFENYSKYIDMEKGSLNFAGKASLHAKGIEFSSGSSFRISLDELQPLGELGRGNYGTVTKVLHKPTNVVMAMKEIRVELDDTKFRQIIMELDILHKCISDYIVDFYGAFFVEGAVYVCMEHMDGGSLNQIYAGGVDEQYLAVIAVAVIKGLKQLKEEHNIIHRDVKPTNILVSTDGRVKLCDFGVSGNLVASIAKTNVGCQSYMAPERIRSKNPNQAITYTVESDIWSLGLSLVEIAQGEYPYPPETYGNIFSQLSAIVDGDPPRLPADRYSPEARSFVAQCLKKVPRLRPSYSQLLMHPWLEKYRGVQIDMGGFVRQALKKAQQPT
jgi:mitogen-activated protein kinase kinase